MAGGEGGRQTDEEEERRLRSTPPEFVAIVQFCCSVPARASSTHPLAPLCPSACADRGFAVVGGECRWWVWRAREVKSLTPP